MSIQEIIYAWTNSNYRASLSEEQRALLPDNPIAEVLSHEELQLVCGRLQVRETGAGGKFAFVTLTTDVECPLI